MLPMLVAAGNFPWEKDIHSTVCLGARRYKETVESATNSCTVLAGIASICVSVCRLSCLSVSFFCIHHVIFLIVSHLFLTFKNVTTFLFYYLFILVPPHFFLFTCYIAHQTHSSTASTDARLVVTLPSSNMFNQLWLQVLF